MQKPLLLFPRWPNLWVFLSDWSPSGDTPGFPHPPISRGARHSGSKRQSTHDLYNSKYGTKSFWCKGSNGLETKVITRKPQITVDSKRPNPVSPDQLLRSCCCSSTLSSTFSYPQVLGWWKFGSHVHDCHITAYVGLPWLWPDWKIVIIKLLLIST